MIRFFPALLLFWLALPASGVAKSAKDCEAIKNPMEFNLCLASLSPVRGSPEARRARRMAAPPGEERSSVGPRGGSLRTVRRGGRVSSTLMLGGAPVQRVGGRKRISFDVRR